MFDVHFFQSLLGKNNLAIMAYAPEGKAYCSEKRTIISAVRLRRIHETSGLTNPWSMSQGEAKIRGHDGAARGQSTGLPPQVLVW